MSGHDQSRVVDGIMCLLTEALEGKCVGYPRPRLASLNSLPNTPAANALNFRAGGIFNFAPLKYGNADSFTQIINVKHFAEEDLSGITTDVRRGEWADDGYAFGQHGEVNEISLDQLHQVKNEGGEKEPTYVMTSLPGKTRVVSKRNKRGAQDTDSILRISMTLCTLCHCGGCLRECVRMEGQR
jgi:hypothetical protein